MKIDSFYALLALLLLWLLSHQSDVPQPKTPNLPSPQQEEKPVSLTKKNTSEEEIIKKEFEQFNLYLQEQKRDTNNQKLATIEMPIDIFSEIENPIIASKEGITPLFGVKIDKIKLQNLKEGDIIRLPTFDAMAYTAQIKTKKEYTSGVVSLIAQLEDEYENHTIIITLGKKNSFATFHTPEGSFELEANGNEGAIYAIQEIDKEWIDDTKEDTLPLGHS